MPATARRRPVRVFGPTVTRVPVRPRRAGLPPGVRAAISARLEPVAPRVFTGERFEARVVVEGLPPEAVIEVECARAEVLRDDDRRGALLRLPPQAGGPRTTRCKAVVRVLHRGRVGRFETHVDYEILPGSVEIRSENDILHWQCRNEIVLAALPLGRDFEPVLALSNGQVLETTGPRRGKRGWFHTAILVPSGRKARLSVAQRADGATVKLDDRGFRVVRPPRPRLVLVVAGRDHDGVRTVHRRARFALRLDADADFRGLLPADARYVVDRVRLRAREPGGAPRLLVEWPTRARDSRKGIHLDVASHLRDLAAGTTLLFEARSVYRVNFQNKKIAERLSPAERVLAAVLR